jgi:hypothetical protein
VQANSPVHVDLFRSSVCRSLRGQSQTEATKAACRSETGGSLDRLLYRGTTCAGFDSIRTDVWRCYSAQVRNNRGVILGAIAMGMGSLVNRWKTGDVFAQPKGYHYATVSITSRTNRTEWR